MIRSRRKDRSPILVVAPRRCLPPGNAGGTSAPRGSGGRARTAIAVAISGPMPGTVISRRATTFSLARRAISMSSLPISTSRWVRAPTSTFSVAMASAGNPAVGVLDDSDQSRRVGGPLRHDLPELTRPRSALIACVRCRISNSRIRNTMAAPWVFLLLTGHEAHRRAHGRFANRFSIDSVVLLPLHEGFDVGGRDETDLVASLADLAAPKASAAAGFHCHDARPQLPEMQAPYRVSASCAEPPAQGVSTMRLKHILRQLEPDRDNLRHDRSPIWILEDPPWHSDAVGERSHHQSR